MKNPLTRELWLLVLILVVGAGLRIAVMQVHGLDGDDAFSVRAALDNPTIDFIRYFGSVAAIDQHPKAYFLALDMWVQVAGTSLMSLRMLNAFADLLLGALLMQGARHWFDARTAFFVGVLWLVNPALIWVGGLVRMYMFLALFAAATWMFLIRALQTQKLMWWVVFAGAALAAAYTQILGAVVLLAAGVIIVVWAVWKRQFTGIVVIGGVGLLYLPYMLQMWARRWERPLLAQAPPQGVAEFWQQYSAGLMLNRPPVAEAVLWVYAFVVLFLMLFAVQRARIWHGTQKLMPFVMLLGLFAVATAGFVYFMLDAAIFQTKFFAFITPLLLMIVAVGIRQLDTRWLQGGALIIVAAGGGLGLWYQLQPSAWDDFPAAAEIIETHGDAGDLVIVMSSYGEPPFSYHFEGESTVIAPWWGISADMPVDDLFSYVIQGYDTVWLVYYQPEVFDPDNLMDAWFRARYPLRTEVFPNRATVRAYDLRPVTADLPDEAQPLDVHFGDAAVLRGVSLYGDSYSRRDAHLHPPSNWIHVTLYWQSLNGDAVTLPSLRLEDEYGAVYGGAIPHEGISINDMPGAAWTSDDVMRADYDINLNPDMPPGTYKIVVRYNGLPVEDAQGADWYILDRVTITP